MLGVKVSTVGWLGKVRTWTAVIRSTAIMTDDDNDRNHFKYSFSHVILLSSIPGPRGAVGTPVLGFRLLRFRSRMQHCVCFV